MEIKLVLVLEGELIIVAQGGQVVEVRIIS